MKRLTVILLFAAVLVGCSDRTTSGTTAEPSGPGADGATPTATPGADYTVQPTTTVAQTYHVGDVIKVTGGFLTSDVQIRIVEVKQATQYGDYSKPDPGNVYLAVKYEYVALEDGATYNPFDWQVFVDGLAVDNFTFVTDGPTPELHSGTLPRGRKASGWIVYDVPKSGRVILSYGGIFGGDAPTFEVVAREK